MIAFVKALLFIVISIFYRVRIIGREKIPASGPALLCANHVTELDMFFIGYSIKRLVHWMAKEELFKNYLLKSIITRLGAFPVRRGTGDIGAIKMSLKLLKEGHIVGIFPEGHRRSKKGEIKVHAGSGMVAVKSRVPVLPVSIEGTGKLFCRIRVVFGDPFMINIEENKKYTSEELLEISEMIMERINSQMEA